MHGNKRGFYNVVFSNSAPFRCLVLFASPETFQTKGLRPLKQVRRKGVAFLVKEALKCRPFSTAPCQLLVPLRSRETCRRKEGRPRRPEAGPSGRRPLTDTYSSRSRRGKKSTYVFTSVCTVYDVAK